MSIFVRSIKTHHYTTGFKHPVSANHAKVALITTARSRKLFKELKKNRKQRADSEAAGKVAEPDASGSGEVKEKVASHETVDDAVVKEDDSAGGPSGE